MHAPMLNIAVRAARQAGSIIRRASEEAALDHIEAKGHNDFVTNIDQACERRIVEVIRKAHPDHTIIAEESGKQPGSGEGADWEWIIDPLDGTTNFIHGFSYFAVSIAVRHKGRLEHAVVLDPLREEEFTASRGRGASCNGRRIRVASRTSLEHALIGTGFPFRKDQHTHLDAYLGMFKTIATSTAGIRRAGAAALDLAYVAAGRLDGFWEFGLSEWDMAAGSLLITEAGGLCSDFNGSHHYLQSGNIICGNPKVFKALLQALKPNIPPALQQ